MLSEVSILIILMMAMMPTRSHRLPFHTRVHEPPITLEEADKVKWSEVAKLLVDCNLNRAIVWLTRDPGWDFRTGIKLKRANAKWKSRAMHNVQSIHLNPLFSLF